MARFFYVVSSVGILHSVIIMVVVAVVVVELAALIAVVMLMVALLLFKIFYTTGFSFRFAFTSSGQVTCSLR